MGTELHLSVIEGSRKGEEISISGDRPMILGRSHTADYRFTEPDISGKHAELFAGDGCFVIRNLSRYITRVDNRALAVRDEQVLSVGSLIQLGQSVKMRVAALSLPPSEPETSSAQTESVTGATKWMPESMTNATVAPLRASPAPSLPNLSSASEMTVAVIEEGAPTVTHTQSGANQPPRRPPVDEAGETVAIPNGRRESWERPPAPPVPRPPEPVVPAPDKNPAFEDTDSGIFPTAATHGPAEPETSTGGENTDGETRAMETRAGSMEEIFAIKAKLEHQNKVRRFVFAFALALFAVFLTAIWFMTATHKETDRMSYPKKANGQPDMSTYAMRENGHKLIEVDFPNDPRLSKSVLPSGDISVSTFMGLNRDVPFNLRLTKIQNGAELLTSLSDSFSAWRKQASASEHGLVFERVHEPQFFEDAYSGSCQLETEYGIPFVSADYRRPWQEGKEFWRGIVIYFRSADTVYVLQREIPESAWERGKLRLRVDPNLAIYQTFSENYWASPGKEKLTEQWSDADLLSKIDAQLQPERSSAWREISIWLNTYLVHNWNHAENRAQGWTRLQNLREYKRNFYNSQFFALDTAKTNQDDKRKARLVQDCKAIFCDPEERFHFLVNNGEIW